MSWRLGDIRRAYEEGEALGASHMLVGWDTFDNTNYPIFVMPGEDPREKVPTNGDLVDECYRYSLGWESQAAEERAFHWEWAEEGWWQVARDRRLVEIKVKGRVQQARVEQPVVTDGGLLLLLSYVGPSGDRQVFLKRRPADVELM